MDCNNCYDLIVVFSLSKISIGYKKNQMLIMGATKVNVVP